MAVTSHRAELAVRIGVVLCLAVDAVIHLRLASAMQLAAPGGLGGGTLFRLQAAAALIAALILLVMGTRLAYAVAGLVALSAFGAVLVYSLVNVPTLGPIPSMYDPTWSTEKVVSAVAEGVGVVLAGVGLALTSRREPGAGRVTSREPATGPRASGR